MPILIEETDNKICTITKENFQEVGEMFSELNGFISCVGDLRKIVKAMEHLDDSCLVDISDSDENTYIIGLLPSLEEVPDDEEDEYEFGELVERDQPVYKITFMVE